MKKSEIFLDNWGIIMYYKGAREGNTCAQYAMKWEIASKGGNFHRVCPVIGRLRTCDFVGRFLRISPQNRSVRPTKVGLFLCRGMIHTA